MKKSRKIICGDCETDPFRDNRFPQVFDVGFFDGENHYDFEGDGCIERAVEWLHTQGNLICFFHNGGKFDFHFFLPFIDDDVEIFVVNGRILKLKWGNIEFRDSYAIIPSALKVGGRKMEMEYWKLEASVDDLTPEQLREFRKVSNSNSPREYYYAEIVKYRRQDNVALYEWVTRFITEYGLGLTIANRAFNELKKLDIVPQNGSADFDAVFRPFYYGGRVECFKSGIIKHKMECLDIKSAYPFAMTHKHFWNFGFVRSTTIPANEERCGASFFEVDATSYGAFPERTKTGISFPNGKRGIYKVTGWEYLAAVDTETAKIHSIRQILVPHEMQDFKPYVQKFYALKEKAEKEGDKSGRQFAKIFLNSAYGRFAINPEKFREHILLPIGKLPEEYEAELIAENPNHEAREWSLVNVFEEAGFSLYDTPAESDEMKYYNVATAASITGFVRAYLWRHIQKVDTPLYCDTDSIICFSRGSVIPGKNLGDFDVEKSGNRIDICGKKLYCMHCEKGEYKIASKGVKLNPQEIEKVAKGEQVRWNSSVPSYSLKRGDNFISRIVRKTVDITDDDDMF